MNDFLIVLVVTVLGILGLFIGYIINHERERKREEKEKIRKAGSEKNSIGQLIQPNNDDTSRASTTPATSTKT